MFASSRAFIHQRSGSFHSARLHPKILVMKAPSYSRESLRIQPNLATVLATAAMAGGFPAHAVPIPVPNPGFEALARADGNDDYTRWAANQDVWRHWTRTENGGPVRIWNPGADGATTQGVLTYGFGGNAPEGNNVALVYSRYSDEPTQSVMVPPQWDGVNYFSATTQLLNGTAPTTAAAFDPTKIYRLAVKVGKPIVFEVAANNTPVDASAARRPELANWHGYAVQLAVGGTNVGGATFAGSVSGGTLVAQDSNSLAVPVDGFSQSSVTYFPNPADAGLAGEFLQLRLCSLDNSRDLKMTGYAAFDDVQLEEFAAPALAYWDLNDTGAGAGGAAPGGTWDAAALRWNAVADGTGTAASWTAGQTAVFSAGADATGSYVVAVDGTQNIGGLAFTDGNVTLSGGTALQLAGIAMADVAGGLTATIATPLTESSAGTELAKSGGGTLVLSGAGGYTGGTTVLDGTLRLGAGNVLNDAGRVTVSGRSAGTTSLDLDGNNDTIGGLVLGGTSPSTAAAVSTGTGTLTLAGDVAFVNANGSGANPLGATISGNLGLGAATRNFLVNDSATTPDDLTVAANITGTAAMKKIGKGALVLSGNNAGATGGLTLAEGSTRFESPAAINGTARDVTVSTPGAAVFGPSFGAANIPATLAGRINASSDGIIAADNHAATDFDFDTPGLGSAFLGAVADVTYSGTLVPHGSTYRIGGGGGTLTLPAINALTGAGRSAVIGGKVILPAANDHGGGTTLLGGTVFPAGPVDLSIGSDNSLGSGPLTIQAQPNASTTGVIRSADDGTRTLANPLVLNGGLNVAGSGNFTFTDTTPIELSATRLFVIGNPVTTFAQGFTGPGGITMDYTGPGTLVIQGDNSYGGTTLINGGTLVLTGNNTTTGLVNLSSRFNIPVGIVLGHDNALGAGSLQFSTAGATVQAQGARTIANAILANGDFIIAGTDALTFTGTATLNNNRIITNSNSTAPTTFANITGVNRNLTFAGAGNTTVSGDITTGNGTLVKNGAGTLTLQGDNTYAGNTTVNAGGCLALAGGSQNSAITVANLGVLGFTPGSPVTSAKNLTLSAGAKIRIIGPPAEATLFTTTGSISGNAELEAAVPGYQLVVEDNKTIKLKLAAGVDYLNWAAGFLPADLSDPSADFDGDGVINNDERIFGLNPTLGSSANPISVPLDASAGTFSFTRRDPALSKQIFSVWTSTTLLAWTEDKDAILLPGAPVNDIETVAVQLTPVLPTPTRLFVRVRAEAAPPPPPLLDEDFEADDGGFTVVTAGGSPWAHGDPESAGVGGGSVLAGNGGSAQCWGTNLTGPILAGTDTSLRSPAIDLSGIPGGTTLSFAFALDGDVGNTLEVNVIDATTGTLIANLVPAIEDDDTDTNWETRVVAIPALEQQVRLEWRFKGLSFGFPVLGAYIDDVEVNENP
jgi:autotransporter-associated beta strand protein